MGEILEFLFYMYLGFGVFTIVLALLAIFWGETLRLVVREKELHGWRYGVTVILLFFVVLFLWPIVWLGAKRS